MLVDEKTFYDGLINAMVERTREALEAEIEPACDRLRARLRSEVANIAMTMMRHYEVQNHRDGLVITVKNVADAARTPSSRLEPDNGD